MNEKTKEALESLNRALVRLEEALKESKNQTGSTLYIDGTIQRFEFCIELLWKTLRRALLELGLESGSPREAIQMGYQAGLIQNEKLWLQMLRDRNQTSHTYEEETAREIFERIPEYYKLMTNTLTEIQKRV